MPCIRPSVRLIPNRRGFSPRLPPRTTIVPVAGNENRREREGCQNSLDYIVRLLWGQTHVSRNLERARPTLRFLVSITSEAVRSAGFCRQIGPVIFGMLIAPQGYDQHCVRDPGFPIPVEG